MALMQALQTIKLNSMYITLILLFFIGKILKQFTCLHETITKVFDAIATERLPPETYWNTLFGQEMFQHVWHSVQLDATKTVFTGNHAINSPVISLQDGRYHRMLEFTQTKRPMVVNFGSLTCPVFMRRLDKFNHLVFEYKDVADFVVVYVEEAHPEDGWAFEGTDHNIKSHITQAHRCAAARKLSQHTLCPVLVDTMLDAANIAYGAFPIRLCIVKDNHVAYHGGSGPMGYSISEVSDWLKENTRST